MAGASYAIGIGSNRRGRHGSPRDEVAAALRLLGGRASRIVESAPVGPSLRRYANAAVVIDSDETPPALLARLKALERAFGRRRGQRWGARVLDLDILLWSEGTWGTRRLTIPHLLLRERGFVLGPLAEIAPGWHDPVTGLRIATLAHRLTRRRHLP